jgi:hypothetical protein
MTIQDHRIPKPESLRGYQVHQVVAEMCKEKPYLFLDRGDHLIVRTEAPITAAGVVVRLPAQDEIVGFELRASVAFRSGGKNVYPALGDWRKRREWLERQGRRLGFEVLAVHVTSRPMEVLPKTTRPQGGTFSIDCTDFKGVLKVKDPTIFQVALERGVGRVGRAFGMGMLIL